MYENRISSTKRGTDGIKPFFSKKFIELFFIGLNFTAVYVIILIYDICNELHYDKELTYGFQL
ncbi:MAG: hypothetical protein NC397_01210 [Clostridium sp.]|nr:hypothetical protein [Clostridium sp.]